MRDLFYRACEAYANGAISSSEYSLMMTRVGDFSATLLMAEAVTGSLSGKGAAIGGGDITADIDISSTAGEKPDDTRTGGGAGRGARKSRRSTGLSGDLAMLLSMNGIRAG